MAFFSGIVKSSLSLLGSNNSGFGYTVGDKVEFFSDQSIWTLNKGIKKEDGSQVSIFSFDCVKNRDRAPLAKNTFKRLRTMKHPDILRYLDGIENEQSIMFVTDPVEPLSNQLNQDPDPNLVLWGIYKVTNAIKFLNSNCNMVHGNVRVSSIFTNKAGEWKLGGFDLLCSMKDEMPIILTFGGLVPDAQRFATPEVKKSGWTVIKDLPTETVDSYHLGCLIYEAYNHRFETTDSLLTQKGSIPVKMHNIYSRLLNASYKARATAENFLEEGLRPKSFFSTDFVKDNLFLENISIKEQSEKEEFFRELDSCINTFPSEFAKYKILPELIKAFEFGSGGAKALSAIVKIGERLASEEYESIIMEPVLRMFASPDRAIRISLLENMEKLIDHMTNKMVSNQVFPNIATGFTDTIPIIREQTIKSTLLLVPKLNERIVNYDLLKHLAKLQMDPEPGIRTNTTICLGKIAKHLSDSTRKKVLIPAFTRSLRDGFYHARVAALMALNATSEYYDAQECTTKVIPAVSVVLIDKEKVVRDQAFKVLHTFIRKIQEQADKMPDTAIVEQTSTGNSPNTEKVSPGAGMADVLGDATKGLAGWAVSSIQSRFASPRGEIGNPINSGSSSPVNSYHNTTIEKAAYPPTSTNSSLGIATTKIDDIEDGTGWDDEDVTPFDDFSQKIDTTNEDDWADAFNTSSKTETFSPTQSANTPSTISSFGSFPSSFGGGSAKVAHTGMKLGQKSKTLDLLDSDSNSTDDFVRQISKETGAVDSSLPVTSQTSKDDRKAELERRREERRQRMAELREKKKGGIGAKKIEK